MQEAIVWSTILAAVLAGPFALGVLFGYLRWPSEILPTVSGVLGLITAAALIVAVRLEHDEGDGSGLALAIVIPVLLFVVIPAATLTLMVLTAAGWLVGKRFAPGGSDATAR